MEELSHRKRVRVDSAEFDSEFELDSSNAKRIRDDLLSLLDDPDPVPERDSASYDLDSVIRSFEEEITKPETRSSPATVIDLTSDSGDGFPGLGNFSGDGDGLLVENETRVDDGGEFVRLSTELSGIGGFIDFPSEFPGYDSFGLAIGYEQDHGSNEYVELDGIFNHSDVNLGSDFSWRLDTLPAI